MPVFRLSYFITVERTLLPIYALTMIEYWCLILSKYVPNICQMAITVTSISDKDDVSCESLNSWYFRVSYLRSMHTSQEHTGFIGFKYFVQIIWEFHKILKKMSNFVLTLLLSNLECSTSFLYFKNSDLPNNCAANLIIFPEKNTYTTFLIYTFINFWDFSFKI